jgi:hypothetical protein
MRFTRFRPNHATVVAYIALFVALGGGTTAVALSGSNTVQSDDLGPGSQVKAPDVAANAVNGADVVNESLTGADIKNRSGVDTCRAPLTAKFGPICAGSDAGARDWINALNYCAGLGLRLPSVGEAVRLAVKFDVPGVSPGERFWTDEFSDPGVLIIVEESGTVSGTTSTNAHQTVCVTDPSA